MPQEEAKPELSLKEKERRWSLLRGKLKAAGVSALLVYGGTQLGVPVHYLTRLWGSKLNMVIFPAEGNPVLLVPSNTGITGESLARQGCWIPAGDVHPSPNPTADAARHIIKLGLQKSKIGIDSFRFWPVFEHQTFNELCPAVQLVESHRLFGEIRGPKSDEELAVMRKAIIISDMAHYAFLANVRPGMTELEAAGYANAVLESHGVGDRIILIHSRPEMSY
ncbi:MAG: aminopeptidase P family N-terminal domain-containing protein, partial [Chloroflexota bacterium]